MQIIGCERFGGLYVDCFTGSRYRAALAAAEQFCSYVRNHRSCACGNSGTVWSARRWLLGDLKGARLHIERMLDSYVARRSHLIRFLYDQRLFGAFVLLPNTLAAGFW